VKSISPAKLFRGSFLVYIAWAKDNSCLYVGRSYRGLVRPATNDVLRKNADLIQTIELKWYRSAEKAAENELSFIQDLRPRFNKALGNAASKDGRRTYLLKLDDTMFEKWQKLCVAEGLTMAEWIRRKLAR
jgi:hypothetical protein